MKKLFVVLAAIVGLWVVQKTQAENYDAPTMGNSGAISADYGGVDVATNSFYVGLATVPSETGSQGIGYLGFYASTTTKNSVYAAQRWRVYGVQFSTGLCSNADFISVRTSSSGATQAHREVARLYNVVFVSTMANGNICGGIQTFRWPIRAYGNLFWGVNYDPSRSAAGTNPYNSATLLYHREE